MVKEFKPEGNKNDSFDAAILIELVNKGEFNSAMKLCNKNGQQIQYYKHYFQNGIKKLIVQHRTSELLSFIFSYPEILSIDKIELLKMTFSNGDYHGFLKNSFRFRIYSELQSEIELAISRVRKEEAVSWRNKFSTFR